MCAWVYVLCMWRSEVSLKCLPLKWVHLAFLRQKLSLTWGLLFRLDWLTNPRNPPVSISLVWNFRPQILMLVGQAHYQQSYQLNLNNYWLNSRFFFLYRSQPQQVALPQTAPVS